MNHVSSVVTGIRRTVAAGTVMLATALATAPGAEAQRSWSTSGSYGNIVIADCSNCDEDIGITIACKGQGQPAEVTVHWAAVQSGQEGAILPIEIDTGAQFYSFQARTAYFGLTGYTPVFQLPSGHPMIGAMQSAHNMRIRFGGQAVDISLNGSRFVIDIFKSHCGWQTVNTQQGTPQVVNPTCPAGYTFSGGQCVRAGVAAPVPRAGQFNIFHGYDLFGGDYLRLPGRVSYQRCMSACQGDGQCRAFTFNTKTSTCFLKSYVPSRSPFKNAISGVRQ